MIQLSFQGVTPAGVDALDRYLADRGMTRTAGSSGSVSGPNMELGFALDLAAGKLTLDLLRIPPRTPVEHIEHAIQKMLDTGRPFGVAGRTAQGVGHRWQWG